MLFYLEFHWQTSRNAGGLQWRRLEGGLGVILCDLEAVLGWLGGFRGALRAVLEQLERMLFLPWGAA